MKALAIPTAERTSAEHFANNFVFQRHHFAYQYMLKQQLTGGKLAEIGSGNGFGMELLHRHCTHYLALDKTFPRRYRQQPNVVFQPTVLPHLHHVGSDSFDTVICFQVIEHIHDDTTLLQEIYRILKPGGLLYLTTPNRSMSLSRNPFHVREYTVHDMKEKMATVFSDLQLAGVYGNDRVMEYYEKNRQAVQKLQRLDPLNLQWRLPAWTLRLPYNLLNHLTRTNLYRAHAALTAAIHYTDFYLGHHAADCLDHFVVARKT